MQKRIINNHTIKVFVTRDDLKQNGITALDLLGDHNQIEKFFYKILNKVDTTHLFTPHEPLTFRVMPNQTGLNIIISCHNRPRVLNRNSARTNVSAGSRFANVKLIQLNSFEDFIHIAHLLNVANGDSRLYLYQHTYYLELRFNKAVPNNLRSQIKNKLSVAYEYGEPSPVPMSRVTQRGKVIMSSHALQQGRYYFH